MRKVLVWSGAAVAVLIVAAIGFLFLVDLSKFRPAIEAQASSALGRKVTIAGEININPSLVPSLAISQVAVANVAGGTSEEMVRVGRLEVGVELVPLINGDVRITDLVIEEATVVLEVDADGIGNWILDVGDEVMDAAEEQSETTGAAGAPFIERMAVRNSVVTHTGIDGRTRRLEINNAALTAESEDSDIQVELESAVDGVPISVTGSTGSLRAMFAESEAWPVDLSAKVADANMSVKGTIDDPLSFTGLALDFDADVASMDRLEPLLGQDLSGFPAFRAKGSVGGQMSDELQLALAIDADRNHVAVDGTISNPETVAALSMDFEVRSESLEPFAEFLGSTVADGPRDRIPDPARVPAIEAQGRFTADAETVQLSGFSVEAGESDLSGDLRVDYAAVPLGVTGEFRSERLDVNELQAVLAEAGDGEGAVETEAADEGGDPLDQPLPVDLLAAANADIKMSLGEITAGETNASDVEATIVLQNSRLAVTIPSATLSRGSMTTSAVLDAAEEPPTAKFDFSSEQFNIGGLMQDLQITDAVSIRLDAKVNLDSVGATPRAMIAGLNGDVAVESDEGEVNAFQAGLFGQSILTAVLPIGGGDKFTINCSLAHFSVTDGVARSTALGVDTEKVLIAGDGGLDLPAEQLDFLFNPKPKDATLLPMVAPVRVRGPLAGPRVEVVPTKLMGTLFESTLGVALVPYEFVVQENADATGSPGDCKAALRETLSQQQTSAAAPAAQPASQEEDSAEGSGNPLTDLGDAIGSIFGGKSE